MLSTSIIAVALAGVATAFTPAGFEPASQKDLVVAFGSVLATNGKETPKADTATAPTMGTTNKLFGTYAIMMVDPDIPPATTGGATTEFLHWMQAGFVSSNTTTTVGGQTVYELVNTGNTSAIAAYIQPSPPNKAPNTHRYTQLLFNTTGNSTTLAALTKAGATRGNFSAANVVKNNGLTVLAGNSFNVTNGTSTLAQSNITQTTTSAAGGKASSTGATKGTAAASASASSTAKANATTTAGSPKSTGGAGTGKSGGGALVAMLGAFGAAVIML